MLFEEEYFLNGQKKSRSSRKPQPKTLNDLIAREEYWENGQMRTSGVYLEKTEDSRWRGLLMHRWKYESPVGEHLTFFENGVLEITQRFNESGELHGDQKIFYKNGTVASESNFENGSLQSKKEWNSSGKMELDDEYHEDGSRVNRMPSKNKSAKSS